MESNTVIIILATYFAVGGAIAGATEVEFQRQQMKVGQYEVPVDRARSKAFWIITIAWLPMLAMVFWQVHFQKRSK